MSVLQEKLGLSEKPVVLAPLAGVSDGSFRLISQELGAELTYVEMISSTAFLCNSRKTLSMLRRAAGERRLGVQVTGRNPDEVAEAIGRMESMPFDTVDINMGCPVQKVTKSGCGSAILRDPRRVYETLKKARAATAKPLSAKIRLGWDHTCKNALEVAVAIEEGGADWLTVHGRTRSDDYAAPVDLLLMKHIRDTVRIPVIGNGNIFGRKDAAIMFEVSGCDGVMVSRGALGNPWVFRDIAGGVGDPTLAEWAETVLRHLALHGEEHGFEGVGAITMRKNILWYLAGWPQARPIKDEILKLTNLHDVATVLKRFIDDLEKRGSLQRQSLCPQQESRFLWNPQGEMDRQLDRGVGADGLN